MKEGFLTMLDGVDLATHAPQECCGNLADRLRILGKQDTRTRAIRANELGVHCRRHILSGLLGVGIVPANSCLNIGETKKRTTWLTKA
jgi:hypothetical protein